MKDLNRIKVVLNMINCNAASYILLTSSMRHPN